MTRAPSSTEAPAPRAARGRRVAGPLEGWPLVGWAALALAAMTALLLALHGSGEEGARVLTRATARSSILLFLAAFTASALCRSWPAPWSRWLLRNRRQLGVSFAVSHALHLAAIVALTRFTGRWPEPDQLVGGGLAYLFLAAMTATSFDRSAAWLGRRRWRSLHLVGAWYIFAIFAVSYLPRALGSLSYAPFALLLLGAAALRLTARRRVAAAAR